MNIMNLLNSNFIKRMAFAVAILPFVFALLYFSACGNNDPGTDDEDKTPPAEVTGLNGIAGNAQITLNWTDPADEDFENVEITYSPGNNNTVQVNKGVQTAVINNLTNGTAYTFNLKTADKSGNKSAGVNSAAYTPLAANPDDHTPPAEVTNTNGTPENGQITLTWTDPADNDFNKVEITYTPGDVTVEVGKGAQTATITGLVNDTEYNFTLKTVDLSGNKSAGISAGSLTPAAPAASAVYMTTRITSEGLMAIYEALGRKPATGQKVAVKISTGEGQNSNHLRPAFINSLVRAVNGDIVECNTAYGGSRASTAMHYQTARDHGYADIATVVIMDESATLDIQVNNGKHLRTNRVGAHFPDYQFHVVLSHFKGHAMAGYGGALKNMSIGYASTAGKCLIHTAGSSSTSPWGGQQNPFLESMAEAAKSIVDRAGSENFIYINVMNRLSVDCDCDANPAAPTMGDIGIFASLDPVALDKACLDMVNSSSDGADLRNRISRQNGTLTPVHAAEIGLGSLEYQIVSID
jgi:uncharacterized Fe-S center protein/chitodextrinase